ncbi:MAG: glutamyl-tRNA reductase [Flammeovirgaceae bacterium]
MEFPTTNDFKALTLSYKLAPLTVRERLALNAQENALLLSNMKEILGIQEGLVISTCNRTEIYYNSPEQKNAEILKLLGSLKGEKYESFAQFFEEKSHKEAIVHLFRVSLGLEAQVIGDLQISNQVKQSYQTSADLGMSGAFLHRLMHTIFFANKRVVQETSFRDGAASVSYAAVEMLEEILMGVVNPRILVVGVGEIGTDVVKNLEKIKNKTVVITNRTLSKAEKLAQEFGYEVVPFEKLWEEVEKADAVISSISTPQPYFNIENLSNHFKGSFKYFLDLSVPRSVAEDAEEIHGIVVYNVDQIQQRVSQTIQKRKAAIPQVENIVSEMVSEFEEWTKELVFSPTIQRMKNALEQIRQEEIARFAKQIGEEERKMIEVITKNMMNKIMKMPVLQLKAACKRGEAETLVDILNDLFNLENARKYGSNH